MLEVTEPLELDQELLNPEYKLTQVFEKFMKNMKIREDSVQSIREIFYEPPDIPETPREEDKPIQQTQLNIPRSTSLKSPPEISGKQTEIIVRAKSKPILTPGWIKNPFVIQLTSLTAEDYVTPNYIESHFQLECCEYRISHGIDQRHMHAGQLIDHIVRKPITDHLDAEKMRRANYEKKSFEQKIPDKWELRPWENINKIMDSDESAQLYSRIDENRNNYMHSRNWVLRPITYKIGKVRSHKKRTAVVIASQIAFETDDDGELTDWEDFEF